MAKISNYTKKQTISGVNKHCKKSFKYLYHEIVTHNKNKLFLSLGNYQLSFHQLKLITKALENHPYIQKIALHKNYIGDEGARSIAKLITKNNIINCFVLHGNLFSDLGATQIYDALKTNKSVTRICLESCNISSGIKTIIDKTIAENIYLTEKISNFLFEKFQNSVDLENTACFRAYFINYLRIDQTLIGKILQNKALDQLIKLESKKTDNIRKNFDHIKSDYSENTKSKIIWQASDKYFGCEGVNQTACKLVAKIIANFEKCIINNFFCIKIICKNHFNNESENHLAKLPNELFIHIMSFIKPKDIYQNLHQKNKDQLKKVQIDDKMTILKLDQIFYVKADNDSSENILGDCTYDY